MAGSLEVIVKRDRALVGVALAGAVVTSWGYILAGAGTGMPALDMSRLPTADGAMAAMQPAVWTASYVTLMLVMWWLMMVAMMLPSAAAMILLYAALMRKQRQAEAPYVSTAVFAAGYLTVWGAFSLTAVVLQWVLGGVALLSPEMVTTSVAIGALLLVGAGIWQLTPLKQACLRNCRSPMHFLVTHWRRGEVGAWRMGIEHGAYCLGCCWALMLLLFYGGVMNVYWIAGLAVLVLIEKTAPAGHWLSKLAGIGLIGWGASLFAVLL
jgi:predicted metal-binding membrane protein